MKQLFLLSIITSLILPLLTFAETQPLTTSSGKLQKNISQEKKIDASKTGLKNNKELRAQGTSTQKVSGFCSQIDKIIISIDSKETSLESKKAEKQSNVAEKRDEVRSAVDVRRSENDIKRKENIAELIKRASTTEQQAAITLFTNALSKALNEKNAAINELLATHRKEIAQTISSRKEVTASAMLTLKMEIEAAQVRAKSDCADGVDGQTVQTTLKASIKKARDAFTKTVQSSPNLHEVSAENIKRRKGEAKKIEATFKQTTESVKNTLKIALKKNISEQSITTP